MPRDIDRKLRLTAAVLGAVTRKDLAKAFRRINSATPFDVERASKWMQGRARPREQQLYEDWAKLLDLGRPAQWIAECDSEAFLEAICIRHGRDPATLRHEAAGSAALAGQPQDRGPPLAGTYACYRHAWSPYFRGRLVRGELSITAALSATYAEALVTGRLVVLDGAITMSTRAVRMDVRDTADEEQVYFSLFPPTPLVSVLAGFMCGQSLVGPELEPSVTRIVMVRLPAPSPPLRDAPVSLGPQESVAKDLAALGVRVVEPAMVDQRMATFLRGGDGGGLDQIPSATYRALAELFDRSWLTSMAGAPEPPSAMRPGAVSLAERRARGR